MPQTLRAQTYIYISTSTQREHISRASYDGATALSVHIYTNMPRTDLIAHWRILTSLPLFRRLRTPCVRVHICLVVPSSPLYCRVAFFDSLFIARASFASPYIHKRWKTDDTFARRADISLYTYIYICTCILLPISFWILYMFTIYKYTITRTLVFIV